MSKPYLTDWDKIQINGGLQGNNTVWGLQDIESIIAAFESKGYNVSCLSRLNSNAVRYDALIINRYDSAIIMEYLFQQRIIVEVEAEGREEVALIFVYCTQAESLIKNIKMLPHRKEMII